METGAVAILQIAFGTGAAADYRKIAVTGADLIQKGFDFCFIQQCDRILQLI